MNINKSPKGIPSFNINVVVASNNGYIDCMIVFSITAMKDNIIRLTNAETLVNIISPFSENAAKLPELS